MEAMSNKWYRIVTAIYFVFIVAKTRQIILFDLVGDFKLARNMLFIFRFMNHA